MSEFKGVKITYQTEDSTVTWESPYIDVSMENILDGFYGLCVAQTWHPSTIISKVLEFAEDRKSIIGDEFNVEY
jgi:hypothetical protein